MLMKCSKTEWGGKRETKNEKRREGETIGS